MDKQTLEDLEFNRIVQMVKDQCRTPSAEAMADKMRPLFNREQIEVMLQELHEYTESLRNGLFIPDEDFTDCPGEIKLLQLPGSVLQEAQLHSLRRMHVVAVKTIHFFKQYREQFPFLYRHFLHLKTDNSPANIIDKILDETGNMRNDASVELQKIRASISRFKRESEKLFRAYIVELSQLGWLREQQETFYNGRRVLAVPSGHKQDVKGMVHGSSETGRTVFIEPQASMELNHRIASLEQDEKKEVYRILRHTADLLRPHVSLLEPSLIMLNHMDFVRAKAKLCLQIDAHMPQLSAHAELSLQNCVHPLLFLACKAEGKNAVPLSMHLNPAQRIMLISGPNAGGKSIALKSAGLCILMVQSGLLIPCKKESVTGIFRHLLTDIGDSQSIDEGLSTYSSRLQKMKHFLKTANARTFFLIDELGAGTDPELGGAIAEALLEALAAKKSLGIVTTHYSNLKIMANAAPGMVNAAMLFNTEQLSPLYTLATGYPGSSFTFEVAEKAGIPEAVLNRAKKKVAKSKLKLNSLLGELQKNKNTLQEQIEKMEIAKKEAEKEKERYNQLLQKITKKSAIEKEKQAENEKLLEMGRKFSELSEEWNETKNKKEIIQKFVARLTAEKHRKIAREAEEKARNTKEKRIERIMKKISIGSRVRILNSHETGIVQEIKKQKARILTGSLISTVSLENIEIADEK
ncbi:MAG: endonuclease MutS2 [Bacteroidota bacterium]|jgi:DNA mismatch repair protein MutS2